MFAGKWISGNDFGEVPDEYVEKTGGIKKWNMKMDYGVFHIPAVLHENGIKIHAKSMMPGKVDFVVLCRLILGVLTHTIAWDQDWEVINH